MTDKTGTVYVLVDPRGDTIRYVGQTTRTVAQRFSGHLSSRGVPVADWIAELRALGLRPTARPIVENVPNAELLTVEQEQIEAHYEQGWPLLNGGLSNWPLSVVVARQRVAKCRAIGGALLAKAEAQLEVAAERHVRDLEWNAAFALRMSLLYPEDPTMQPEAAIRHAHAEGNARLLTPEGWENFGEVVTDLAAALKPHGYTFREVLLSNVFDAAFYLIRNKHGDRFDPRQLAEDAA
jgi:hypothetical protein